VLLASVLLAASGCAGSGSRSRSGPSGGDGPGRAPSAAAVRDRPGPGEHRLTLSVNGQPWPYLIHAPASYDGSEPVPVVLALHGRPSTPEAIRQTSNLDRKADKEGFLAVFPRGEGKAWNPVPHSPGAAFLRALITHLQQVWKADPRRVYIAGFSNGGAMTIQAAADLVDLVAAVAPVSPGDAAPDVTALAARPAPPLIGFYGDRDSSNPFTLFNSWRAATGCAEPKTRKVRGVQRESSSCRGGTETVVYALPEMDHDWPGGGQGTALEDDSPISATDLMWEFFKQHAKDR
jgi:polyhydroxybutyrate depolymerase